MKRKDMLIKCVKIHPAPYGYEVRARQDMNNYCYVIELTRPLSFDQVKLLGELLLQIEGQGLPDDYFSERGFDCRRATLVDGEGEP